MPPRSIPRQVEDIIFYYYAKLVIAPSAGLVDNYGFIIDTYKRLKSGEIRISDYERELLHISATPKICAFCGTMDSQCKPIHVVSGAFGILPGMHNLVIACETCRKSISGKDLVEWWCNDLQRPRDDLPRVPLGIYLKIAYELHKMNFSLRKPCQNLAELFVLLRHRRTFT